jgi:Fe-S-cluster containining protein
MVNRQERRVLLRQAVDIVSREGLSERLGIWAVVAATKLILDRLMGRSPRRASHAAATFLELYDRSLASQPPAQPFACRAGCTLCCHNFVAASAPELFLLADELRRRQGDGVDELIERVRGAHAAVHGLSKWTARLRPCVVLVDQLCSGYAARPIACRAFASFSLEKCEQAFRTGSDDIPIPGLDSQLRLRGACNQALWSALARVGLPSQCYELTHGLLRVLETPDAERRWLAGEDVMPGVQVDEMSAAGGSDPEVRFYYEVLSSTALGREPPKNPWL